MHMYASFWNKKTKKGLIPLKIWLDLMRKQSTEAKRKKSNSKLIEKEEEVK